MLQKFLLSGFVLLLFFQAAAQNNTVTGRLRDAENASSVQGATVVLRSIRDTLQQQTTYTDTSGKFRFDQLARDSFQLIISSIGFETIIRSVKVDTATVDLGAIDLPRTSQELSGVVVRSSIPPATQKGDTVQFNASQFKVNPDASAEDLARKMPGITVENGQVKANGENVQKVTIDGRELFGDDATAALRNLPAEIIDKIQVFDRLSDQAQLTGFDDGNTQKGINIVTKANMRNGQFGRVYAGYGTDSRYQAGGNATFLKDNRRISVVGNFNNTNQQNFSQQDLLGVTSTNNQRGGGGGGPRGGGGGNPRGGGGNAGGNPGGNFGNNANFLVGQQAGINTTNALGLNYSDLWGKKVTTTGSYFFNNTHNTTDQLSNTQYLLETIPDNQQHRIASSRNNNHRFNLRMEYRIDSANQLIITPNISFQDNQSEREVNTTTYNGLLTDTVRYTNNFTTSNRNGYNANNNILFRHSFPKRGRSFSVNLRTAFNERTGESYVTTFERQMRNGSRKDTMMQRFTDQMNNGSNISTNLSYTEPLGQNSQLQLSYNPSFSNSKSDQAAYGMNPDDNKYSIFYDSLSNKFQNNTQAQNAGLSYRWGNRDRQISFGVNYQQTALHSEQNFPQTLTVNKTFRNFLPNARVQYKISDRSSLRLMYRASTELPSVTQLQNVVDITDPPFFTAGNPELEQQYMHFLSTRYTYTNTGKGLLLVANIFAQKANNYITEATFVPTQDSVIHNKITLAQGQQLIIPVNLDGYSNLRSFITFAVPLKFIKSTFNVNGGVGYARLPGIINNVQSLTHNYTYNLGSVVASNISEFVDFTLSYAANFGRVKNISIVETEEKYFSHAAGLQLNLLNKKGWFFQNDITNQLFDFGEDLNTNFFLWNMSAGKKILKDQKGELRFSVFDLLKQNQSITREINDNYIRDVQNQMLTQYFMLTFSYNLRNFGTAAVRGANRNRVRN